MNEKVWTFGKLEEIRHLPAVGSRRHVTNFLQRRSPASRLLWSESDFVLIRIIRSVLVSCVLLASVVNLYPAQEKPAAKHSSAPANMPSMAELYKQHCAACHGDDLKGAGPFPPPYRKPPDLTTLARRHGGTFPDAYVSNVLRNGVKLPAHGPAEMPVWGTEFEETNQLDKTQVASRIKGLTNYLKLFQVR
jgi:mono/diheme cytochrome c family protein